MDHKPIVSVIVPVRNAEAFLDQCINGLVNQSLQSIEIVCVDDESTDASKEILLKYARRDDRIKIYSQSKAGAGAARNLGMSRASGEYFAFIDADDFVEADYLEEMLGQCRLHDADICLCAADIYNNSSGAFEKAPWMLDEKLIKSKPFNVADAGGDIFFIAKLAPWAKLFSAKFVHAHQLKFQPLQSSNDLYFVLMSMCLAEKITVCSQTLMHYRSGHSTNIQSNLQTCEDDFCKALVESRKSLQKISLYDKLGRGFSKLAARHIDYNLRKLKGKPQAEFRLIGKLKELYLPQLGLAADDERKIESTLRRLAEEYSPSDAASEDGKKPKLSIVVPVYNVEAYLDECLQSLTNQTFKDIEIVCVNDGSTDGSARILEKYRKNDRRIKVVGKAKNEGLLLARRDGVYAAAGDHVVFVDSDDYLDLSACRTIEELLEKDDCDILQFACSVVNVSEDPATVRWLEDALTPKGKKYCGEEILKAFFVDRTEITSLVGKAFKRKLLMQAYSQMPFYNCYVGEDVYQFFYFAFFAQSCVGVRTKGLYFYRRGSGVTASSYLSAEEFERNCSMSRICGNIGDFLQKNAPHLQKIIKECVSKRLLTDCLRAFKTRLLERDKSAGERMLVRCWGENELFASLVQTELGISDEELRKKHQIAQKRPHTASAWNEENRPKVSVIVPVFNCEKYLTECLESLTTQNEKSIEIICVNDGSTDGSLKILERFCSLDNRITLISTANQGLSVTRNLGLKYARGKYVRFLDSDDKIGPGSIERLFEFAEDNGLDLLAFGAAVFYENEQLKEKFSSSADYYRCSKDLSKATSGQQLFAALNSICEYRANAGLLFIRRDFLKRSGIEFIPGILHEDEAFGFECLLKATRAARINEIHYLRRIRPDSIMTKAKSFKNLYGYLRVYMEQAFIVGKIKFENKNAERAALQVMNNMGRACISTWHRIPNEEKKKISTLTALEKFWFDALIGASVLHGAHKSTNLETRIGASFSKLKWAIGKTIISLRRYGLAETIRKIKHYQNAS